MEAKEGLLQDAGWLLHSEQAASKQSKVSEMGGNLFIPFLSSWPGGNKRVAYMCHSVWQNRGGRQMWPPFGVQSTRMYETASFPGLGIHFDTLGSPFTNREVPGMGT